MPRFPVDAPKAKVISSTLISICTQANIPRSEFLKAYNL